MTGDRWRQRLLSLLSDPIGSSHPQSPLLTADLPGPLQVGRCKERSPTLGARLWPGAALARSIRKQGLGVPGPQPRSSHSGHSSPCPSPSPSLLFHSPLCLCTCCSLCHLVGSFKVPSPGQGEPAAQQDPNIMFVPLFHHHFLPLLGLQGRLTDPCLSLALY